MVNKFKALILSKDKNNNQKCVLKKIAFDDLMQGNVTIKIKFSSLNYKDGLAISGKKPIIKKWPMIPGVDFCGEVVQSNSLNFKIHDKVILNGWGVGETHFGGFSEYARVKSEWLLKLPEKFTEEQAMIIGSAGYTSMLCVIAIMKDVPTSMGEILVTGASGGVGSIAVHLLSKLGYDVVASTGKIEENEFLKNIGANRIIDRNQIGAKALKPLSSQIWGGAIDTVGGITLSNILSQTKYGGLVAATGLAQSAILNTTVYPFILRNITLKGIDSVYTPIKTRIKVWKKLSELIDYDFLDNIKVIKNFSDLKNISSKIINGKIKGRVVIKIGK